MIERKTLTAHHNDNSLHRWSYLIEVHTKIAKAYIEHYGGLFSLDMELSCNTTAKHNTDPQWSCRLSNNYYACILPAAWNREQFTEVETTSA